MNWKSITYNIIWFSISFSLILIFSTQDKEWFINGREINNICDVMTSIESDDIRFFGAILTLPLFFPFLYAIFWKKQHSIWQFSVFILLMLFWLWRFIFRYLIC
ncbi:DUF2645 family protein [Enterobacter sp.]|uniref:DUF2645 family protein n=1 Tax=Enterobacter sp. TaxID=42895 RepID=UPI00296E9517|nr:DUF2645 family protein [Enterobacter sp.]